MRYSESRYDGEFRHVVIRDDYRAMSLDRDKSLVSLRVDVPIGQEVPKCKLTLPSLRTLCVCGNQSVFDIVSEETIKRVSILIVDESYTLRGELFRLGCMPALRRLYVRNCQLDEGARHWICEQSDLEALDLSRTDADDFLICGLTCLSSLKLLQLDNSQVRWNMRQVKALVFPRVRSLSVSGTAISDADSPSLIHCFPRLQRLIACGTPISSHTFSELANEWILRVLETGVDGVDYDKHKDSFWDI